MTPRPAWLSGLASSQATKSCGLEVGTLPDANYRGYNWDFGPHVSADGIIEYQDKTFGGALQGALLVTEYSAGSDIVMLTRDASGNVDEGASEHASIEALDRMNESGRLFVSSTRLRGRYGIRVALGNGATEWEHVARVLEYL